MKPINVAKLPADEVVKIIEQLESLGFVRRNGVHLPRSPAHDYASWDWSKRNVDLAREYGVSQVTVAQWRKRLNQRPSRKYHADGWDWSKPDAEIAREHKVPVTIVRNNRIKLGKPFAKRAIHPTARTPAYGRFDHIDWANQDWKKADIDLAREIGCTREYVRQKRAQMGQPKRHKWMNKYDDFLKFAAGRKELHSGDIAGLDICPVTFARYCTLAGIKRIRNPGQGFQPDPRFALMNWRLPNKVLQILWRMKNPNAVGNHRCNFHLQSAAFVAGKNNLIPDEFMDEVKEEERKASEYFKTKKGQT